MLVFRDYGSFFDLPFGVNSTRITYRYMMQGVLSRSESENVQNFYLNTLHMPDTALRYQPFSVHLPLVVIEHLRDFSMPVYQVWHMRYAYNFLNYALAALFFFLILRKRFPGTPTPLFGLLMFFLNPRFFGYAFYNDKDMMFFSWYIISAFFALRFIEKPNLKNSVLFAAAAALATNTRVIGVSIVLLALLYVFIMSIANREAELGFSKTLKNILLKTVPLGVLYMAFFTAITPFLWGNPFRNFIAMFNHFRRFQGWSGTHFYMGELITRDVPWHYVPVWMGITIPVMYTAMFIVGCAVIATSYYFIIQIKGIKVTHYAMGVVPVTNKSYIVPKIKNSKSIEPLYDTFFFCLFFISWLGLVFINAYMYVGWRHTLFLFASFLYISVLGVHYLFQNWDAASRHISKMLNKIIGARMRRIPIAVAYVLMIVYLSTLGWWIARNHPFQYVFFNEFSRGFAEDNFELDYWGVSQMNMLRIILGFDDRERITVAYRPSHWHSALMLPDAERLRFEATAVLLGPDYLITTSRGHVATRRAPVPGYEKIYAIEVNGMAISTLHRYLIQPWHFDRNALYNAHIVSASVNEGLYYLLDGNPATGWGTYAPRQEGDYVLLGFSEPVSFNLVRICAPKIVTLNWAGVSVTQPNYYADRLNISVSSNGSDWYYPSILFNNRRDFVLSIGEPYRYIRFENAEAHDVHEWNITGIHFGNIDWQQ